MLCQPQEVLILRMVGRMSPRQFHTMGKLRSNQEVPRWTLAKGRQIDIDPLQTLKDVVGDFKLNGTPLKNKPGHPAPQGRDVRWPSLKGESPLQEESPKCRVREQPCDTRAEMAYQLPPPTWQTEAGTTWKWPIGQDQGRRLRPSWLRRMWISSVPASLEPHLHATPRWGGALTSGCWGGRQPPTLPLMSTPPPPLSLPYEDSEPSPLYTSEWLEWHARYVQMPSWWEEFTKIPSHHRLQRICLEGACLLWGA